MATVTVIYNSDARRVSGLTRITTCDDVIEVLLRTAGSNEKENAFSFAIFESVGGIERLLPGNTRLLKLQNSWGDEIDKVKFVLRKSHCHGLVPKISIARRKRLCEKRKPASPSVDVRGHCQNTICSNVSERKESARLLVQLTQTQKTKIQKIKDKITGLDKGLKKFRSGLRFKKFANAKVKSSKDENSDSMDEFLANVNEENMENLLNFCDRVASQELERFASDDDRSDTKAYRSTKNQIKEEDCSVDVLEEKLKEVQQVLHKYAQSTRTLQKAGVDITKEAAVLQNKILSRQITCQSLAKEIFSVEESSKRRSQPHAKSAVSGVQIIPMHSTPIFGRAMTEISRDGDDANRRPRDTMKKCLPTGRRGKHILMQKYLKQQASLAHVAKNWVVHEDHPDADASWNDLYPVTSRIIKSPAFNTLQERCKFYWDLGCDSDSDSDSAGSNESIDHDLGFMDSLPFSPNQGSPENSFKSDHLLPSFFESPNIIEPSTRSSIKTIYAGKRLVDYSIGSETSYNDEVVIVYKPERSSNGHKGKSVKSHSDSDTGLSSLGSEGNLSCCKTYIV